MNQQELIDFLRKERNEYVIQAFHSGQKAANMEKQLKASVITATSLEAERDDLQRKLEAMVLGGPGEDEQS